MELDGSQLKQVWEEVLTAYDREDLKRVMAFDLEKDLFDYCSPADNDKELVFKVVDRANRDCWIEDLVQCLMKNRPDNEQFQSIMSAIILIQQDVKTIAETDIDPHNQSIIGRRVLINRLDLRAHMRKFTKPRAFDPRLLVVKGPDCSGKTYTREFVKYLAASFNLNTPIYIKLSSWPAANCLPDDLIGSILSKLGFSSDDVPINDFAQATKRALKLKDWFIGKIRDLDAEQWIILDDLDHSGVPEETIDLVSFLANEIVENMNPMLRLVLLGFERPFSPDIARDVLFENLEPIDNVTVQQHAQMTASLYLDDDQEIVKEASLIATEAMRNINMPFDRNKMFRLTEQFETAVANFLARI